MFGKKKMSPSYDPAAQKPVLRCSICTGEQVAGFRICTPAILPRYS